MAKDITLREYLEQRIKNLRKHFKHHAKTTGEELKRQAIEYERRLGELNHEAERLQLMVPKTLFDEVVAQFRKELTELQLARASQEGGRARSQLIAIVSTMVAVVALLLNIFKR